ncbi:MAG: TIGR04053 family radical SAM/SPASM domain-containing protein [Thermoplasmataceae archaeon]|jgi:radical SAM protein
MISGTARLNYNKSPILIFWETTKACDLACRHCRASAIMNPLPDEMNVEESIRFVRSISSFEGMKPVTILSGGDVMKKRGLKEIIGEFNRLNLKFSLSPSATERLNEEMIRFMKESRVASMSLSLDGSRNDIHDGIRGVKGVYERTLKLMGDLNSAGIPLQINTTVMRENMQDLPAILKTLIEKGIGIWEVFFLITTGRGSELLDLTPDEYENVNKWLLFSTSYGIRVRTVESPMYRRIVSEYNKNGTIEGGALYRNLVETTIDLLGPPNGSPSSPIASTSDGKGTIFVAHNGDVYPSGFLHMTLGNVRKTTLKEIYTGSDVLKRIRDPSSYDGKCGICEYNSICGGSRARSFNKTGNPFGSDPACAYIPKQYSEVRGGRVAVN